MELITPAITTAPRLTQSPLSPTPHHPYTPTSFTDRDRALINAYFDQGLSLCALADQFTMTVVDLADWATQPHIAQRLAHIQSISASRAQALATLSAESAIAALNRVITSASSITETIRRAATTLLRRVPRSESAYPGRGSALTPSQRERAGGGFSSRSSPTTQSQTEPELQPQPPFLLSVRHAPPPRKAWRTHDPCGG